MPTSPSVENYMYGAGALYIMLDDIDVAFRHVGNVPTFTYTSEVTTEQHKQSMSGIKSTDFEFVTEITATCTAVLEEVTPENMQLFVLGSMADNTDGNAEIAGLTLTEFGADLKYVSDNANGRQIELYARVNCKPNGEFNFISEGLTSIPVQFEVLKSDDKFGRWVFIDEATV